MLRTRCGCSAAKRYAWQIILNSQSPRICTKQRNTQRNRAIVYVLYATLRTRCGCSAGVYPEILKSQSPSTSPTYNVPHACCRFKRLRNFAVLPPME